MIEFPTFGRGAQWKRALVIGAIYFLAASATIMTTRFGGGVAMLWVATAVLLAELSLTSAKRWAAPLLTCGIASFAATNLFGFGPALALPLVAINLSEAVIGALLMHRLNHRRGPLASLRDVALFVIAAGIAAPAITAFGGASVAAVIGGDFWTNWVGWFTGHALGTIAFAPIVGSVMRSDLARWKNSLRRHETLQNTVMIVVIGSIIFAVFSQDSQPLLFLPVLAVMVATIWRGQLGAGVSVVMLALIGGGFTISGAGPIPLTHKTISDATLFFQFYLAVTMLTVLPVAADLTRRKILHDELLASEARYRLVTENSSDLVLNLDTGGTIVYASQSSGKLGNYNVRELLGKRGVDLVYRDDQRATDEAYAHALLHPDRTITVEYRSAVTDEETRWYEARCRGIVDEDSEVSGVVCSIRDISDRKVVETQLARDAATDFLTGLPNRRAFMKRLESLSIGASYRDPGCVAIVDLDHFKLINDRHGHQAGDDVLKKFAQCASGVMRGGDVIARIGGEEFGLIFYGASIDQATVICERLRSRIESTNFAGSDASATIRVTISAGVAELKPDKLTGDALAGADAALYRAKAAGRNRLAFAA